MSTLGFTEAQLGQMISSTQYYGIPSDHMHSIGKQYAKQKDETIYKVLKTEIVTRNCEEFIQVFNYIENTNHLPYDLRLKFVKEFIGS